MSSIETANATGLMPNRSEILCTQCTDLKKAMGGKCAFKHTLESCAKAQDLKKIPCNSVVCAEKVKFGCPFAHPPMCRSDVRGCNDYARGECTFRHLMSREEAKACIDARAAKAAVDKEAAKSAKEAWERTQPCRFTWECRGIKDGSCIFIHNSPTVEEIEEEAAKKAAAKEAAKAAKEAWERTQPCRFTWKCRGIKDGSCIFIHNSPTVEEIEEEAAKEANRVAERERKAESHANWLARKAKDAERKAKDAKYAAERERCKSIPCRGNKCLGLTKCWYFHAEVGIQDGTTGLVTPVVPLIPLCTESVADGESREFCFDVFSRASINTHGPCSGEDGRKDGGHQQQRAHVPRLFPKEQKTRSRKNGRKDDEGPAAPSRPETVPKGTTDPTARPVKVQNRGDKFRIIPKFVIAADEEGHKPAEVQTRSGEDGRKDDEGPAAPSQPETVPEGAKTEESVPTQFGSLV